VSSADARKIARQFDAAFFEVSAAEESAPVRRIFLEAARAVVRELERCVPLRSLYLDDHSGAYIICKVSLSDCVSHRPAHSAQNSILCRSLCPIAAQPRRARFLCAHTSRLVPSFPLCVTAQRLIAFLICNRSTSTATKLYAKKPIKNFFEVDSTYCDNGIKLIF